MKFPITGPSSGPRLPNRQSKNYFRIAMVSVIPMLMKKCGREEGRNLQGCISLGPRALRFFFCHHEIYPIPEKQTFRLNINAVMPLRYLPLLTSLN